MDVDQTTTYSGTESVLNLYDILGSREPRSFHGDSGRSRLLSLLWKDFKSGITQETELICEAKTWPYFNTIQLHSDN